MKRMQKKLALVIPEAETNAATGRTEPPLAIHWEVTRWYIAVHENGFGLDTDPAKAILDAQESVAGDSKPSQLLIYVSDKPINPTGFVKWPNNNNGTQPKLVGLTNTHQAWERRPR